MEATTTRASTVIKSIPTSEIRTHASMTIPLSSTRSSTSIRLEPPDTRSTDIEWPPSHHQAYRPRRERVPCLLRPGLRDDGGAPGSWVLGTFVSGAGALKFGSNRKSVV